VFTLLNQLPVKRGVVKRIFIHLERNTLPARFEHLGDLVVPVRGACQLGLVLYELELVDRETVHQACKAVTARSGPPKAAVDALVADARERGLVSADKIRELAL